MNELTSVIPNHAGWPIMPLSTVSTLLRRGTAPVYVEASDIHAIGQRCVTNADFKDSASRPHSERAMNRVLEPRSGDVLINSTGTGTIGRSVVFNDMGHRYIVDGHVTVIRPSPERAVGQWINEALRSSWGQEYLESHCYAGSTNQIELSSSALATTLLAVPPVTEQRRICEVFHALDRQIRATNRIIAKLRLSRQGLVNDLLMRKPPNSTLADSLVGMPTNGIYKPAEMIGSGSLLVGQTAITPERLIDSSLARRAVISQSELDRFGLEDGDILVSRVFATIEGVGQPALVRELPEPAVFESNMMRLRPNELRADSFFLFQILQTRSTRARITQRANLSNQASIAQDVLTSLPIWLPRLSEQRRICAILRATEERRIVEENVLRKLRLMRVGLMSDLLTGRVRVSAEAAT